MAGWLRRNAVALGAVVVLVPASLFVTFSADWSTYYADRPSSPVRSAAGDTVEFGKAEWTVTEVQRIRSADAEGAALLADADVPAGADVVVVELAVSAIDGAAPGCLLSLEETRDGRPDRSWSADTRGTTDLVLDPQASPICDSEATGDYTIETLFVVPADTGDDLRLSVQVVDELPSYLSVSL